MYTELCHSCQKIDQLNQIFAVTNLDIGQQTDGPVCNCFSFFNVFPFKNTSVGNYLPVVIFPKNTIDDNPNVQPKFHAFNVESKRIPMSVCCYNCFV